LKRGVIRGKTEEIKKKLNPQIKRKREERMTSLRSLGETETDEGNAREKEEMKKAP